MAHNLISRITALEGKMLIPLKVFSIICKSGTPTLGEQKQLDDAKGRGEHTVCIWAIDPARHDRNG